MDLQARIDNYLEIEQILNSLFDGLGYCLGHCISKPDTLGHVIHNGCCKKRYYQEYDLNHPVFELLKAQREALYGTPASRKHCKRISPCEYHTLRGCVLKTHKSPVCLGFLCVDAIDVLREAFAVFQYDYSGIHNALEWILTGDLAGKVYDDFKAACLAMAETVNRKGETAKCER